MKRIILNSILFMVICLGTSAQETFTFGTKTNPDGKTIEVDNHGFIFDGTHRLPVMGEIHFSRVPQADWRREIRKMKAGGITILATYIFWIHHEPEEGQWNWTGNNNLRTFLQVCKEEGMPVVLRLGPFCHGEVYLGGIPSWMVEKAQKDSKQYKLRSTAPGFLAATKELYRQIGLQAKGMLWKDGGCVVGAQLENECRGPWNYFTQLKSFALEVGLDLPFYTRTGWPKLNGKEIFGEILPLYGDYADGFWDRSLTDMPGDYPKAFIMKDGRLSTVIATETFTKEEMTDDSTKLSKRGLTYPYLTCELGGGMMPAYHRRINISGDEAFPLAICKLGSGSNLPGYYMYHGGSNPYNSDHTMAECQASSVTNYNDMPHISYDFQCPLGEMGQPNWTAFHQTRWLHQFLADWGEELAMMDVDSLSEHYARRGCFEFRNNYVRILYEKGVASVTPKDMKWDGLTISSSTLQPFAKADGGIYFIGVKNSANVSLTVNGKEYALHSDQPTEIEGKTITFLSEQKARTAYVIDGRMHYARHNGILYKTPEGIIEESWEYSDRLKVKIKLKKKSDPAREVKMGSQKVAEQPSDKDFDGAAVYSLRLTSNIQQPTVSSFLEINYKGDCARVYVDDRLVEDNFWNGKPMLVRCSQLQGKKVELRILPLRKDAPIYLQQAQRYCLQAAKDTLLSLDSIKIIERKDYNL